MVLLQDQLSQSGSFGSSDKQGCDIDESTVGMTCRTKKLLGVGTFASVFQTTNIVLSPIPMDCNDSFVPRKQANRLR